MASLIRVAIYLLIGAIVHTVLYGAPIWDSVWTWAIIVFWPLVLLLWLIALSGLTVGACLVGLVVWVWIANRRDRFRAWRRRRADASRAALVERFKEHRAKSWR